MFVLGVGFVANEGLSKLIWQTPSLSQNTGRSFQVRPVIRHIRHCSLVNDAKPLNRNMTVTSNAAHIRSQFTRSRIAFQTVTQKVTACQGGKQTKDRQKPAAHRIIPTNFSNK